MRATSSRPAHRPQLRLHSQSQMRRERAEVRMWIAKSGSLPGKGGVEWKGGDSWENALSFEYRTSQRCQSQGRARWSRGGAAKGTRGVQAEYKRNTSGTKAEHKRISRLFLACRWPAPDFPRPVVTHCQEVLSPGIAGRRSNTRARPFRGWCRRAAARCSQARDIDSRRSIPCSLQVHRPTCQHRAHRTIKTTPAGWSAA
jgi:hypothetical protein